MIETNENIKISIRHGYLHMIIKTFEEDRVVADLKEIFNGTEYNVYCEDERKMVDRYER